MEGLLLIILIMSCVLKMFVIIKDYRYQEFIDLNLIEFV